MPWIELSCNVTEEAIDWVRTLLATTGCDEDIQVRHYVIPEANQISDTSPAKWQFTIRVYLPYDNLVRSRVDAIEHLLQPLHRTGLATELQVVIVDEKPTAIAPIHLSTQRIGHHFIVLPSDASDSRESFLESPDSNEIILRLPNSLSFGSGFHPTTTLCLQLIEGYLKPQIKALDLGSGSGILSIAMAKMGATVLALDNDAMAVQATQKAVALNQVSQQVAVQEGSLGRGSKFGHWMGGVLSHEISAIEPTEKFDLVVANIPAHIHIELAPDFRTCLQSANPGGLLITSGFTRDREEDVQSALIQVGFEPIRCQRDHAWVAWIHRLVA